MHSRVKISPSTLTSSWASRTSKNTELCGKVITSWCFCSSSLLAMMKGGLTRLTGWSSWTTPNRDGSSRLHRQKDKIDSADSTTYKNIGYKYSLGNIHGQNMVPKMENYPKRVWHPIRALYFVNWFDKQ